MVKKRTIFGQFDQYFDTSFPYDLIFSFYHGGDGCNYFMSDIPRTVLIWYIVSLIRLHT
jgi:hypothetical protein